MGRRWLAVAAALTMVVASLALVVRAAGDDSGATVAHSGAPARPEAASDPIAGSPAASPVSPLTIAPATTTTTTIPLVDGVAFVGDSLAENLAAGLAEAGPLRGLAVFDDAISGCGVTRSGDFLLSGIRYPLSPACGAWSDTWTEDLRRDRPKIVAIQVGRHEVLDRLYMGRWTSILEAPYRAYVRGELELAIRIARAQGAKVVLLTVPKFSRPPRPTGLHWQENDPVRVDRFNEVLRELAAADRTLTLIDLGARTSPGTSYVDVVDGVDLRSDGVHYSTAGVEWIGPWLLPQLTALLRR